MESRTLTYRGPAAFVGALAQVLREDGLEVTYQPPEEYRSAGEVEQQAVVALVVMYGKDGIDALLRASVEKYRQRFKDRGTVTLDDWQPDDD
ncbi:MAG TPA: hypothetical protein VHC41_01355 [Mycobacteriales bacterium]|nr:hypothetical protein [Mycobacteriales bacterium]